jgi:hypothetical protein
MGRDDEAIRIWRAGLQQFPDSKELRARGKALGLDRALPPQPSQSL